MGSHVRQYLSAVLVPKSSSSGGGGSGGAGKSSSQRSQGSASASASSDAGDTSSSDAGTESEDEPATPTPGPDPGTADTSASTSSGNGSVSGRSEPGDAQVDVEVRIQRVLDLLKDPAVLEEDPDKLKQLLLDVADGTEAASLDADTMALAVMHRHREDVHPTGQTFSAPSTVSRTGSLSRSSSFRRNLTPTSASALALKRAGILTPTRPLSPSPLRANSPSLANTSAGSGGYAHYLDHPAPSLSGSSAPSSPFGSPRLLNATAPQFKPNASAAEFRPHTPTALPSPAIPSLTVKMPDLAFKTRSPMGTPAIESPSLWSFQNSPLGTPRFATSSRAVSPAFSGSQNGSYFPHSTGMTPQASATIPSNPWNKLGDASDHSSNSNSIAAPSISTASSEHSYDENSFDPFSSTSGTQLQESSGKEQILQASQDDEEWKIPSVESLGKSPEPNEGLPRWNMYDDEDDDDEFQILQYKDGKLLKDELLIVEPPQLERPTFDAEPVQQSTDQYSQLPQDIPIASPMGGPPPGIPAFNGGGLGESGEYIMTPLDVLYSIFAGSDLQHSDLEDALQRNGWDVDRAMEWIINNPQLPGAPRMAEDQIDRMNMLSLDPTQLSGSGAVSPARGHPPSLGMSGSRPLIMSRDSFSRQFGPGGKPQGPRWATYSNDGSRPGTPSRDRGGDGYFGAGPTGQASPSTRLCKYYLQGNCLRSDCRFSHDLSKAVCKFWLRGHCLKGEGRCEFLHSVPPHLAQDVAQLRMNSLRVREQEKARWLHRGQPEEERIGFERTQRVEEDFPSLAAATASAANRAHNANKDPATSRWTQAVKQGRPAPINRPTLPRSASATSARGLVEEKPALPYSQPRQSGRLALRPPTLLPTVSTGAAVSHMYEEYRANFFKYGEARNKCLVKAASCWQKGDGAGARRWSREAQDWNRQIAREGALASGQIIAERKKVLREAVMSSNRPGRADEMADRQYRGVECGGGLGVCLGVAAASDHLGPEGPRLSVAERTEVALDLHGLHPDEALEKLEAFLLAIASEHVMRGLTYVIVGQERHTGTADANRGTRKVRLADAVGSWLDSFSYSFWLCNGIMVIDPYL